MDTSTRSFPGRPRSGGSIGRTPLLVTLLLAALLAATAGCTREEARPDDGAQPQPAPAAQATSALPAEGSQAPGPRELEAAGEATTIPDGELSGTDGGRPAAATAPQRDEELARREAVLRQREAELARREELAARERELAARESRLAEQDRERSQERTEAAPTAAPSQPEAGAAASPDLVAQGEQGEADEGQREDEPWNESWRTRARERDEIARRDAAAEAERRAALERLRAGTTFDVAIQENLSSGTNQVGDTFRTRLTDDVRDGSGALVVPAGSVLWGEVTDVRPLRRVGGQATLALQFQRLELPTGESVELRATFVELGRNKKKDKAKIAGAAIAGAILGRILGDGEAAVVGAAVGAAAGTAAVMSAEGREVELPEGTEITLELQEVVTVTTRYGEPLR